jgi:hypothetical protein
MLPDGVPVRTELWCGVSVCAYDVVRVRTAIQYDITVFCNGLSNIALTRDAL